MTPPRRVLVVTSEWPTERQPTAKQFVAEQVDSLRRLGIDVDVVPTLGGRRLKNYRDARAGVAEQLATGNYDVVHVHMGQCALAVPPTDVPMVVTFHGSDLLGIVGPSGRYTVAGSLLRRFSRRVARRAAGVIVVANRLVRRLPRGVRYDVIPCGVDLDTFRPGPQADARRALGFPVTSKLVLFSGSPDEPTKRFGLAQDATRTLAGRFDVSLLTVTGRPREVVRDHILASDAVLITSRHETGPLMAKEAAACNVPVVSVDVGDLREWLTADQASRVVADATPRAIGAALADVFGPDRPPSTGRALVQRFALEPTARSVARVYDRVVAGSERALRRR